MSLIEIKNLKGSVLHTNEGSLKEPWDSQKRANFEERLYDLGWRSVHAPWIKGRTIYEKGRCRIEVDDCGIFLFEDQEGQWIRTRGLSDDNINQYMRRGSKLGFRSNSTGKINLFDCAIAKWVMVGES